MWSRRVLSIVTGLICLLLASCGASAEHKAEPTSLTAPIDAVEKVGTSQQAVSTPPPQSSCRVYGLTERGSSGTKLVSLGLGTNEAKVLASFGSDADMSGIAAVGSPIVLYGIGGLTDRNPGRVYALNSVTGERTTVLNTGYLSVGGLAARSDGTLWTWADAVGLVKIDPVAKTVKRMLSSLQLVDQMAWVDSTLYVYSLTGQVYKWKDGQTSLALVTVLQDLQMGPATPNGNGKLISVREPQCQDSKVVMGANNPSNGKLLRAYQPLDVQGLSQFGFSLAPRITWIAWPTSCGTTGQPGDGNLIRSVTLSPTSVCSGDTVTVTASVQHPDDSTLPVDVQIQGQSGSTRTLQVLTAPGKFMVAVTAATSDGLRDRRMAEVTVTSCPNAAKKPLITASVNPIDSRLIDLRVANRFDFGANATYEWDFGDGAAPLVGAFPYAAHDYQSVLGPTEKSRSFLVRVTERANGSVSAGRTTIVVDNDYAIVRALGRIQVPVSGETALTRLGHPVSANVTLRLKNIEPNPVAFKTERIRFHYCDGSLEPLDTTRAVAFTVPANSELAVPASIEGVRVLQAAGVCTVSVHYEGATTAGTRLTAQSHHYLVVEPPASAYAPVTDPELLGLLNSAANSGKTGSNVHTTDGELRELAMQGRLPFYSAGSVEVLGPDFGDRCNTGEAPPRAGLSCQVTDEWESRQAYIANALKGDSVMTSGCTFVHEVLSGLSPTQFWTHTGIMTKNHVELRNSTGTPNYMEEFPEGSLGMATDGFSNHAVKYLWPGTVTQSIFHAYYGEYVFESFSNRGYNVLPFSQAPADCDTADLVQGRVSLVQPAVIRPPLSVTQAQRERLHQAADAALGLNAHYRFFAYSNALKAAEDVAPATAKAPWSRGTRGLVCSTFIWQAMREVGIQMEGVLEPTDEAAGGVVDAQTTDGLYFYDAQERSNAGLNLWRSLYNKALDKGGGWGHILADAPEDVADQITTCFSTDDCSVRTGSSTHGYETSRVGVGRTVSPDNMLLWDSPDQGGPYGDSERLVFVVGDYRRVQRWAQASDAGSVGVQVTFLDDPVHDAAVEINGLTTVTDTDGRAELAGVPAGTYEVDARVVVGDLPLRGTATVEVLAGQTATVLVKLDPPPSDSWVVTVAGLLEIKDDEIGTDVHGSTAFNESVILTPETPPHRVDFDKCVGGEVSAAGHYVLTLSADHRSVDVVTHLRGFETTSCANNDGFGTSDDSFKLEEGTDPEATEPSEQHVWTVNLKNNETSGGDTIKGGVTFTISRAVGLERLKLEAFRRLHLTGSVHTMVISPYNNADGPTFSGTFEGDVPLEGELFVSPLEPRVDKTFGQCLILGSYTAPDGSVATPTVGVSVRIIAELQSDLSIEAHRFVTFGPGTCGNDFNDGQGIVQSVPRDATEPIEFSLGRSGQAATASGDSLTLTNEQAPMSH